MASPTFQKNMLDSTKDIETSQQLREKLIEIACKNKKSKKSAPKRPFSAYLLFCLNVRQQVKDLHDGWNRKEVTSEIGRIWRKEMSDEMKEPYVKKASFHKKRYEEEINEYTYNTITYNTIKRSLTSDVSKNKRLKTTLDRIDEGLDNLQPVEEA
jgi:hypothetical protein